jgi:hypothetical protein
MHSDALWNKKKFINVRQVTPVQEGSEALFAFKHNLCVAGASNF